MDDRIISGDVWDFHDPGIVIVSVNSRGIHGRGLAKQAQDRGLIARYHNRKYYESPWDARVRTICVKGAAPETARVPGQSWSESVTGKNVVMLRDELTSLTIEALSNPWRRYYVPFIGLGFGEGNPDEILPVLRRFLELTPNATLVSRSPQVQLRYAASLRPGVRRDASSR